MAPRLAICFHFDHLKSCLVGLDFGVIKPSADADVTTRGVTPNLTCHQAQVDGLSESVATAGLANWLTPKYMIALCWPIIIIIVCALLWRKVANETSTEQ